MNTRKQRQDTILRLIESEPVSTQDELIARLREEGFEVTQATVSRDIKELQLMKKAGRNGRSVYTAGDGAFGKPLPKYNEIITKAIISVDYAGNTCVLKTHTGMAGAACAAFDAFANASVVGTIAGDDTVFILCRTEEAASKLCNRIKGDLA